MHFRPITRYSQNAAQTSAAVSRISSALGALGAALPSESQAGCCRTTGANLAACAARDVSTLAIWLAARRNEIGCDICSESSI